MAWHTWAKAAGVTLDGASELQVVRRIKLPALRGSLVIVIIFSIIGTFQMFNEPQILPSMVPNSGVNTYYTPNLYAYTLAFTGQEVNYAAAVSFLLGLVIVIASYTVLLATSRRSRA